MLDDAVLGIKLGNTVARASITGRDGKAVPLTDRYMRMEWPFFPCRFLQTEYGIVSGWAAAYRYRREPRGDIPFSLNKALGESDPNYRLLLELLLDRVLNRVMNHSRLLRETTLAIPGTLPKTHFTKLQELMERLGLEGRVVSHETAILRAHGLPSNENEWALTVRIGFSGSSLCLFRCESGNIECVSKSSLKAIGLQYFTELLLSHLEDGAWRGKIIGAPDRIHAFSVIASGLKTLGNGRDLEINGYGECGKLDGVISEEVCADMLEAGVSELSSAVSEMAASAGSDAGRVSMKILGAGGGFQVPLLQSMISERTGLSFSLQAYPDETIQIGALLSSMDRTGFAEPVGSDSGLNGAGDFLESTMYCDCSDVVQYRIPKIVISFRESPDQEICYDNKRELVIGRDPRSDIPFSLGLVSRRHARIELQDGAYFVTDCSTNGTFVNGERLIKWQRHSLRAGDLVTLVSPFGAGFRVRSIS